ncbi:ATP-binding protein [Nannocystis punicea]|uniref:histidine kinase n=1 Tax=Nannocystis punicea TaxID=2995304 RepID=A0ABY7HFD5_9BACT|nr:ATP-binding protein [Nannocystis poenicansa]WAS97906.1 ATP-binding protein [Nannocystis poenicansa]
MLPGAEFTELMDDALLVVSPAGAVEAANAAAGHLLGVSRAELVGRDLAGLLPDPALAHACRSPDETRLSIDGGPGVRLAARVIPRPEGAWVVLRPEPAPLVAPDLQSNQRLRTLLSHAPVVMFACDARGVLVVNEPHGLSSLRPDPGDAVGRTIFDAYGDIPWVVDAARRALAGESLSAVGDLRGVLYEAHYSPLRSDGGEVLGFIGVAIDVTEREQTIERYASQQAVFKYVLANVPQAIFWKDRESRYLGCNQHFLKRTRLTSPDEVIGKTDYDICASREEADHFRRMDRQVMRDGVPILNVEEPMRMLDGTDTYLLTSKVPIRDDRGEVTGLLGIYVDITERKHMELELQAAKEAADAALRAKSEFLTTISHELRTPLALILGPLESLLADVDEPLGERTRAALTRMWRNASRLGRLVDDILDYQKLEAGKLHPAWEPVDVRDLVEDIVLDAEPAAQAAGLTLRYALASDLGTVPLDRRMFEKILLNLLGNALKFTPAGGSVTVELARGDGPRLRLLVRDTGPGIAPDEHERVFQRFEQLDSSITRKHEGTGLGLAIVREFTQELGGTVELHSALGQGACFVVDLPIDADRLVGLAPAGERVSAGQAPFAVVPAEASPEPAPELPRLLVAEDNPDMRAYIAALLGHDYAVELTANGRDALHAARARRPDVILADVMMPEMDGYELVTRLKRDDDLRDVPVVLLSAKASREETARGLDVGADDYLPKPFAPVELRSRVRAALRLHRTHLEVVRQKQALEEALRALEDAQDQLVQSSKMAAVGALVAGLSHELNNPVAVIRMSAQMLLRRSPRDPFMRRALERIERHSQRCAALVEALLAYTRRRPPSAERCELGQVLRWLVELVRPEADERGIRLVAAFGGGSLPALVVHRPSLESALLNVFGNAADATGPGGAIEILARAAAGTDGREGVEIVIRDSGVGIAAHDLPHVFEPFYTTKPPGKGTGLGLSMAQKFVRSHGGTIRIDSEVGRGTAVRMWLPLLPPEPPALDGVVPPRVAQEAP